MVVALGPGKFYGSSLPRPRFFIDVKFNEDRVDPPPPVMDPLMAWAQEAHWSTGGLSFKRHRLQGRIEGKVERLRVQLEHTFKRSPIEKKSVRKLADSLRLEDESESEIDKTPSPPPASVAIKRRRIVGLEEEEVVVVGKKGTVRKLGDDFERVARESGMVSSTGGESGGAAVSRTRSRNSETKRSGAGEGIKKGNKKLVKAGRRIGASVVAAAAGIRSSPRLAKRR